MRRLDPLDDFPGLSDLAQGGNQQGRSIVGEAKRLEELSLPPIIRMGRIHQVLDDLMSFDQRQMSVSQFHWLTPFCRRAPLYRRQTASRSKPASRSSGVA